MKHIHFVGIKGVGMTPLAIIAKEAGFTVTGCDVPGQFITDVPLAKAEITVLSDFNPKHVKDDVDLVITTAAHGGFDNPEVQYARGLGITILTQGQALGKFMEGRIFRRTLRGISIAGCHGKTSTTAMVATVLQGAGLDPSYVIGTSDIVSLPSPGHYGKGHIFLAEADEYVSETKYDRIAKFLYQFPSIIAITNIEFDHPDVYTDIDQLKQTYLTFTHNLTPRGKVIVNGDDLHTKEILSKITANFITFGQEKTNDVVIHDVVVLEEKTQFYLLVKRGPGFHKFDNIHNEYGPFFLSVPGVHSVYNATIACIIGILLGISTDQISAGLSSFKGTKRRLEYRKTLSSGALLYDDYGHHPTEISVTLKALKDQYPDKKIVCIFQPHTYSRTKELFTLFSTAFGLADEVILAPIFASAREVPDLRISSDLLASEIQKNKGSVISLPDTINVIKYINEKQFGNEYILVTMGAGDIYKIADSLV